MSLVGRTWRLWRDQSDLSPLDSRQRYTGTISEDGRSIAGAWEICHESITWEHDLGLSYHRLSEPDWAERH